MARELRIPKTIFRDYDIRGKSASDLSTELAFRLGVAFAELLGTSARKLCVGGDMRPDTPELKAALARGLSARGVEVVDLGIVPTPLLYFGVCHLGADGGVAVTASHNPPGDNGFKFCRNHAGPVVASEIQEMYRTVVDLAELPRPDASKISARDLVPAYLDAIRSQITVGTPRKIVVDAGNGMLSELAPGFLRGLGMDVTELFCEIDGSFPNHPADPTVAANLADLIERVRAEGADFGVGYDGDGDRVGAVDRHGRIIWGDQLLAIFSQQVLRENPGAGIVFEVKCSRSLIEEIERWGGRALMGRTGHSNIKARMKAEKAPLGGEMSGHMFFADRWFGFDDALYATARLVEIISAGRDLAELLDALPHYPSTPEIRVACPDERKFQVVEKLIASFSERFPCIAVDGVRFDTGAGWGLVRASNTSPKLIVRAEGETEEELARVRKILSEALSGFPELEFEI